MLIVLCSPSQKETLKNSIVKNFAPVVLENTFRLRETDDGFVISGDGFLYWGTPTFDNGKLTIEGSDINPAEAIRSIKKEFHNVSFRGSLQFGDDNYREYYWFESEPDCDEVLVDKAVDCNNVIDNRIGAPLNACSYTFKSGRDLFAILEEEGFDNAAMVLERFKDYISDKKGKPASLWNKFTDEDHEEFEWGWTNLFGTYDSVLKMSDKFIDDFFKKYQGKNKQ